MGVLLASMLLLLACPATPALRALSRGVSWQVRSTSTLANCVNQRDCQPAADNTLTAAECLSACKLHVVWRRCCRLH